MARAAARGIALVLAATVACGASSAARAARPRLTVAAYYYAWYDSQGTQWSRGFARGLVDPPQLPALGAYDSRDPALIAAHYDWAHRYGVDVFLCSWLGPGEYDDGTIQDSLLPSPARGATRIGLLYESIQRLGVTDGRIDLDDRAIATLTEDFTYLAGTAFRDPGYYRIRGRPVVVLYASRIFVGKLAEAVAAIRTTVQRIDGVDPYLIGDEIDWDMAPDRARIGLYDAITGYTLYSRTQPAGWPVETRYLASVAWRLRQFRRAAAATGVGFVPGALPGFNDRGIRPDDDHHVLPHELDATSADPLGLFSSFLRLAGSLVDPALRLLTVTSWNEWHEDTQIEPTASDGVSPREPTALTQGFAESSYGFGLLERLAAFKRNWRLRRS